jgi:hypothetical protein
MTTIDSELILNPGTATFPFWSAGQTRLIVIFEIVDDKVIARGLDPDQDAIVFRAKLRSDQRNAFLAAVRARTPPVSNQNAQIDSDVVVVGGPGPGDGGPKCILTLAATG